MFDEDGVKTIEECVSSLDAELRELSLEIHGRSRDVYISRIRMLKTYSDHPETAYEER